jgi:hypothetical protein
MFQSAWEWVHNHFRGLNPIAFAFSCFFVCYGLMNVSETAWIRWIMIALGLYVEYVAQWIWGLSFTYEEHEKKGAGWLKFAYLWYFSVFAIMSGVGFIVTELVTQETAAQKVAIIEQVNQRRIDQLSARIDQLQKQLEREGKSGAGPKYFDLETKLAKAEADFEAEFSKKGKPVKVETKAQMKDMFANLSKVFFGINKYFLIGIMAGSALVMVYLKLILNPMKVTLPGEKKGQSEDKPPATVPNRPIIRSVAMVHADYPSHPSQEATGQCLLCGKKIDGRRSDALFCSDTHKKRYHRTKGKEGLG